MSDTIRINPVTCPKCGTPISAEAPQNLCPKCLLAQAAAPTEAGDPAASAGLPPAADELRAAFPQLEILDLIGRGGMGFVYQARQAKLERFVALKILPRSLASDPAFAERFAREGRMLARLSHPNIVTVYDFGQAGEFFYLLMEFVDGVNLRQAMHAGRFTPAQALSVVPKICEALQFAHEEGILHRDIKPENILLDAKGRIKIADFGIAKLLGPAVENSGSLAKPGENRGANQSRLTETGKIFGTPHYMAPEQIENPAGVDQRADIYSLGVVFYEMLTGELPLGRFAAPSLKSDVDARVDEIVLKALEKEREHRQRSAGEMKTQVETVAQMPPGPSSRAPKPAVADRFWRRFAIASVIVLLGLVLLPILYLTIGLLVPAWQRARARSHPPVAHVAPETNAAAVTNPFAITNAAAAATPNATATRPTPDNEVLRLKLAHAEKLLNEAAKRREVGTISELEYDKAKLDRDVLRAELSGDPVAAARLKLQFAETNLKVVQRKRDTGMASPAEYDEAKLARDIAAVEVSRAQQAKVSGSQEPADLREARARLAELRIDFGDNHPAVGEQLKRIQELERLTREEPDIPADLREAKAKLAVMRLQYGDSHPLVQAQVVRIKALEGR